MVRKKGRECFKRNGMVRSTKYIRAKTYVVIINHSLNLFSKGEWLQMGTGIFLGWEKCSKIGLWWWLYNSVNFTKNQWITVHLTWVILSYVNHISIKGFFLFFLSYIYLSDSTHTSRGATGRGGSRLPAEQGAQSGTRSYDPGLMTWAKWF